MNRIEKLIKEKCPDGVERVRLGEVCEIYDGTHQTPKYKTNGIKFVSVENIDNIYNTEKYISEEDYNINYKFKPKCGDLLMTRIGSIGRCAVVTSNEPIAFYVSLALIRPKLQYVTSKYLKYILESKKGSSELRKRTLIHAVPIKINLGDISYVQIPLPPLYIQQEIVKILDSFTALQQNLEDELKLRQKQYEHYCDKLYGSDYEGMMNMDGVDETKVVTFDDLGTITRGKRFVRDDVREEGQPCIHYGDMYTYYGTKASKAKTYLDRDFPKKMRYANKGDVVIVGAGENNYDIGVGLVWMGDEPAAVHDACYILEHNINPMYISYYLRSNIYHLQLKKYVSEGKICSFSGKDLGRIKIPVQSPEKQSQIVQTLDHFESLISNIKTEIELRKKQYEYYREKLLTF